MTDPDNFLSELDSMIEATVEFIRDDDLTKDVFTDPERFQDLAALLHVRKLWEEVFEPRGN